MYVLSSKDMRILNGSIASSSLSIQDLVIEIVKMHDVNVVKLTMRKTSVYKAVNRAFHVQTQTLRRECTLSCASYAYRRIEKFKYFVAL